jgi:hypothetical protein
MRRWGRVLGATALTALTLVTAVACSDGGGKETATTSAPTESTTSSDSTTSDSTTSTTKRTTTTKKRYSFGLPGGDLSPAEFERDVYRRVRTSCSAGQAELNARWSNLISPLNVLLFQSAVHACRNETKPAKRFFDRAGTYGWSGINSFETVCNTYKAVRSVLEQIDPASVACPGGSLPPWPQPDPSEPRDDPRTDVDERTTTTTTTTSRATSSTTR